jgi:hypothetical protein
MPGMGPPPKDPSKRARRNAPTIGGTVLPANGRTGPIPRWPFGTAPRQAAELQQRRVQMRRLKKELAAADEGSAEARRLVKQVDDADLDVRIRVMTMRHDQKARTELWRQLWRTPQAVMWERLGIVRAVAMYVEAQIAAERGDEKQAKEARYRETDLGLNPKGMQNLRWTVAEPELDEEQPRQRPRKGTPPPSGSRARRGPLTVVPDLPATGSA